MTIYRAVRAEKVEWKDLISRNRFQSLARTSGETSVDGLKENIIAKTLSVANG